jgi:hypothetical protein
MPVRIQTRPVALAIVFVSTLLACSEANIPRPRFPQVEQATEAVQGGGERYRAHRACTAAAKSVDGLIGCMREAGFDFITRGPGYPEADCWQSRDRGETEQIPAQCFLRSREPAREATPGSRPTPAPDH